MKNYVYNLISSCLILLLISSATAYAAEDSTEILLFLPAILSSSHEQTDTAPDAFIDSIDVEGNIITLRGHYKDEDGDPLVSASWVLKNDKQMIIRKFSGLDAQGELTEKGEITVILTVTTGAGGYEGWKTSAPLTQKVSI